MYLSNCYFWRAAIILLSENGAIYDVQNEEHFGLLQLRIANRTER